MAQELKLLAIVGPTASGKTALAINIAKKYNGEIIAADSRTVYKGLDIGTAKPDFSERAGIKHYGFDLIEPSMRYSAAQFKEYANQKISQIVANNKLPILVGGTGLYIDSVIFDYKMPPTNRKMRHELEDKDTSELQAIILKKGLIMPVNSKNRLHLITAIERAGALPTKNDTLPKGWYIIGLKPDQVVLKERIKNRAEVMFDEGVVEEYKRIVDKFGENCPALNGGIYKYLKSYINGEINLQQCKDLFGRSDKYLAKRQMTWFKRNREINWFNDQLSAEVWVDKSFGSKIK